MACRLGCDALLTSHFSLLTFHFLFRRRHAAERLVERHDARENGGFGLRHRIACLQFGALGIEVKAKDYGHDLSAMRAAITPKTRIVFVANPNNPTGTWLAGPVVEAFIASVPRDVLVVLDEADRQMYAAKRSALAAATTASLA